MADVTPEQSQVRREWAILAFAFVVLQIITLGNTVGTLSEPASNDPAHPAIKKSATPVAIFWWVSFSLVFARRDLADGDRFLRAAVRTLWATGAVDCLLHIAIAFHLGHGWSHEAAWEHTKRTGGYGDGVFVNYAFALVWLVDAVWVCVAFDSYLARPRWLQWSVHGFLAFVVFNAAVVFGSWGARWTFGLCLLVALAACFAQKRRSRARFSD